MANWGGYGQNQGMINQLMRQKENKGDGRK